MRKQIGMIKNKIAITPEAIKIILLFIKRWKTQQKEEEEEEATEQTVCKNRKRIARE